MDLSIKRTRDFYEGQIKREKDAQFINDLLFKHNTGCRLIRYHANLKAMNTNEKVLNNKAVNYLDKDSDKGMSLHYRLINLKVSPDGNVGIPFIFMYEESGGVYLKIPSDYKPFPELYLKLLADNNYHILIVGKASTDSYRIYSRIISLKFILKNRYTWKWAMSTSKGNTNRLQFYGELSNIKYTSAEEPSLFEPCLIKQLENLFDQ